MGWKVCRLVPPFLSPCEGYYPDFPDHWCLLDIYPMMVNNKEHLLPSTLDLHNNLRSLLFCRL